MAIHHNMRGGEAVRFWTPEEDRIIDLYYAEKGPTWIQKNHIPERSLTAISKRGIARTGKSYKAHNGISVAAPEPFNPIPLPPDNRTEWQRMMGDPRPGQSALDKR